MIILIAKVSVDSVSASDLKCAYPSFDRAFETAHSIFLGKVVEEKKEGKKKHFRFRVEKYWKGSSEKFVEIMVNESFRYQAPYRVGEKFLVFAKQNEDTKRLWDGRCSRSTRANEYSGTFKEDFEKLGKGKNPKPSEENE